MRAALHSGRARSGSALLEFVIALVPILLLVAGLLQLGTLSDRWVRTYNEARGEAAALAMSDTFSSSAVSLVSTVEAGRDGAGYSADDQRNAGSAALPRAGILQHARPEALMSLAPGNPISAAALSDPLAEQLRLVRGSARSDPVPLLPVVRHLLYQADSIRIENDATLTWTKGLD